MVASTDGNAIVSFFNRLFSGCAFEKKKFSLSNMCQVLFYPLLPEDSLVSCPQYNGHHEGKRYVLSHSQTLKVNSHPSQVLCEPPYRESRVSFEAEKMQSRNLQQLIY